MTINDFKGTLASVCDNVSHGEHFKGVSEYIVWHETGSIRQIADDESGEKVLRIAVDYFTKSEYDYLPEELESAWDEYPELAYGDVVIDYNEETGHTRYIWTCEVIIDG